MGNENSISAVESICCRNAIFVYGMVKQSMCEDWYGEVKVECDYCQNMNYSAIVAICRKR